ncbi:MAG: cytochrome c3 family protein [Deltaproteobacteria bacterium]|nr:cytochrome c3 family protein [Deltaproteobacteria bacterium]
MSKYLILIGLILLPTVVSARWIKDIVTINNDAVGSVAFSHYQHLDALGKNCVLCHNRIFQINPKKNRPVSMAEMEQGKSCGACHNGETAFSVKENCESCHE